MAYSDTINLVSGDNLPELIVTLRDSNAPAPNTRLDENNPETWNPIDLSNCMVVMNMREVGEEVLEAALPMVIEDAQSGICSTIFPAGTLNRAGIFEAEIEVNKANGAVHTVYDLVKFKVREQFDV